MLFFFFKQKTAYEMRISDWSSDVFSSDLARLLDHRHADARFAVEHPAHAIILAAEFDPRHILEPRDRAILRVGLDDDIGELLGRDQPRSEEHTSELQSLMRISYAVFCLKKKKHTRELNI